jgi:hypothetical protein
MTVEHSVRRYDILVSVRDNPGKDVFIYVPMNSSYLFEIFCKLREEKLIKSTHSIGTGPCYAITRAGLRYIIRFEYWKAKQKAALAKAAEISSPQSSAPSPGAAPVPAHHRNHHGKS